MLHTTDLCSELCQGLLNNYQKAKVLLEIILIKICFFLYNVQMFTERKESFIFSTHNKEAGDSTFINNHPSLIEGVVLTLLHSPLKDVWDWVVWSRLIQSRSPDIIQFPR